MRNTFVLLLLVVFLAGHIPADDRDTDFDPDTDFTQFKTFSLQGGKIMARAPELNSSIVQKRIEEAIRAELISKGLREETSMPDLRVTYRLGAANRAEVQTWRTGRWRRRIARSVTRYTEGTLVVDLIGGPSHELVWRGIYRDDESQPEKIAQKIEDDIKKLFQAYPPKK